MAKKTHYEILGIRPDATKTDIKQAYQLRISKIDSSRNQRKDDRKSDIEAAYSILSDGRKRRAYDRRLEGGTGKIRNESSREQIGKSPHQPKRVRPRQPMRSALRHLNVHKWLVVRIGLIALIVDWLLAFTAPPQGGGSGQGLWLAITITVFVWTARQLSTGPNDITARQAFYEGSHAFIKQFLIILFWTVCLLPFIGGSLVYAAITSGIFAATTSEQTVFAAIWFLLSILSFYLVLRTIFAMVLIHEAPPVQAIRRSWRMTRRRLRWVAPRIIAGVAMPVLLVAGIYGLTEGGFLTSLPMMQALTLMADALIFIVVLPAIAVIIEQLYEHEKPRKTR